MTMTLFQARFIQWLTLNQCSLRATAGNYYARYNFDGTQKKNKVYYEMSGGNQYDGLFLRKKAIEVLRKNKIEPHFEVMGTDIKDYDLFRTKKSNNL